MWPLLLLALLSSCAHSAEWKEVFVDPKEEVWRHCSEERDGPNLAGKGWCWQGLKCKDPWYKKPTCKPVPYFCAYGDLDCMKKYHLDEKVLVHPGD